MASRRDPRDKWTSRAVQAAFLIALSSLQPSTGDPSLPKGAEVGLAEASGRYITTTSAKAFPPLPRDWKARVASEGTLVWYGRDAGGRRRVYAAARRGPEKTTTGIRGKPACSSIRM